MASRESFNNNAVEADGIRMEIWEPDFIVLPIPKNRLGANTPVQINVYITNNTATPFPFIYDTLIPELVKADGKALHPQKLIDRQITTSQYNGIFIPPHRGYALVRSLIAKLCQRKYSTSGLKMFGWVWCILLSWSFALFSLETKVHSQLP
ncbi:hypothetical protein [Argonema antarcticum]|uniref:hypothetical protein n=1 Tax=Argonema antarcticum TaxID=2942763 RepID=UPI00201102F2|nr:hypothetical protein [Argonema antarcticum]MCL1470068.1 hypothetical protein [Argonema antarcticum A004/B2]